MVRRLWFVLVVALVALSVSCSDDDSPVSPQTIVGSGNPTQETRTISSTFHSISLRMPAQVTLTSGTEQEVIVTVDDNVLQYVQTTDSSGTLIIRLDPSVNVSDYDLAVALTMTNLEGITCESPGTITGTNKFTVDAVSLVLSGTGNIDLEVETAAVSSVVSGAGNITLSGSAASHSIVVTGAGNMYAFYLTTVNTSIVISGVGNAEVNVSTSLNVVISGIGSVYYKGHPDISQEITGTGRIFNAN